MLIVAFPNIIFPDNFGTYQMYLLCIDVIIHVVEKKQVKISFYFSRNSRHPDTTVTVIINNNDN